MTYSETVARLLGDESTDSFAFDSAAYRHMHQRRWQTEKDFEIFRFSHIVTTQSF